MQYIEPVLSVAGAIAALLLIAANLYLLKKRGFDWAPVLYILLSLFYSGVLLRRRLVLTCTMDPVRALIFFGGVFFIFLCFLRDTRKLIQNGYKELPSEENKKAGQHGGDGE